MIRIIPPASCLCVYLKSKQVIFLLPWQGSEGEECRSCCCLMALSHATSETGDGAKQKSYRKTVTCRGNTWLSRDLLPECSPDGICKSAHEDRPTDIPIPLSLTAPQEARVPSNYIYLFSQKSILSSFVILPLVEFHRIGYIWGHWQMLNYILMPWEKISPSEGSNRKQENLFIFAGTHTAPKDVPIYSVWSLCLLGKENTQKTNLTHLSYRKQRWFFPNI